MTYHTRRSHRKTLALTFDKKGELLVRAPFHATDQQILAFVSQHTDWIAHHQKEILCSLKEKEAFDFRDGLLLPWLGKEYPIQTGSPKKTKEVFFLTGSCTEREEQYHQLLRQLGAPYLKERVAYFARLVGETPHRISITSARTRWGSCNYNKSYLNFSLFLFCLSPELIDSIIVHELCHLIHPNHSPAFYHEISGILPQYTQAVKQIKEVSFPFL